MSKLIINNFTDEYKRLSNFYPVLIDYKGRRFPSVEHAYVASKSSDMNFWKKIASIRPSDAGKAKRLGRNVILRPGFEDIKLDLMEGFLKQKFNWPSFKEFLLRTEDAIIIEGNFWHDNYWGDCYCKKCLQITGQNNLGKLIMKIRETLS